MRNSICQAALIVLFFSISINCASGNNRVMSYLENAELQYEGKNQRENIETALNDILILPGAQLKIKRYKDYSGRNNQWNLTQLIYRHFVPDRQHKTLGDNFYSEIKTAEVQSEVKKILMRIKLKKIESLHD